MKHIDNNDFNTDFLGIDSDGKSLIRFSWSIINWKPSLIQSDWALATFDIILHFRQWALERINRNLCHPFSCDYSFSLLFDQKAQLFDGKSRRNRLCWLVSFLKIEFEVKLKLVITYEPLKTMYFQCPRETRWIQHRQL